MVFLTALLTLFFGAPTRPAPPARKPVFRLAADAAKPSSQLELEQAVRAHFRLINFVGRGSTGCVFQAISHHSSRLHAVKTVKKSAVTSASLQAIRREIAALRSLNHAHVLRFHCVHEDDDFILIATEFCLRGDLLKALRQTSVGFSEARAVAYMRQVFSALCYLHRKGVSHLDVKPENILIAQDGSVRLADFGSVHSRTPTMEVLSSRVCGSPQYAAPEVLQGRGYVPQFADAWSCGISLFVLLTRSLPFDDAWWRSVGGHVGSAHIDRLLRHRDLVRLSDKGSALIAGLLTVNPCERMSAEGALRLCDSILQDLEEARQQSPGRTCSPLVS